jgi:hypothetical protein
MPYPPKRVHSVSIRSGLTFPVWMGKTSTPSARPPVSYAPPSGPYAAAFSVAIWKASATRYLDAGGWIHVL